MAERVGHATDACCHAPGLLRREESAAKVVRASRLTAAKDIGARLQPATLMAGAHVLKHFRELTPNPNTLQLSQPIAQKLLCRPCKRRVSQVEGQLARSSTTTHPRCSNA